MSLGPEALGALWLSVKVAVVAMLGAAPVALAVAWLLARREFPGKALVDALAHLPLLLPPVVTGYALLLLFGSNGVLGRALASIGIVLSFRWTGAALACAVMGFPFAFRAMRLSIEAVDRRLEQAAATLGAAPWRVFATVTLPLALPGVVAGMVLCFAKAMGEFGATITFVAAIPGETLTMPSAIYAYTQAPGGDRAALALAAVSVAVSLAALLAANAVARFIERRVRGR